MLRVGSLTLHRCWLGVAPAAAWCGTTQVPLDYSDATAGTITVGFGWVPASGRSVGTVVAEEGGPGYPSTGTTPDYLAMIGPLHADHDLLVVDARGTGRSTPGLRAVADLRGPTAPTRSGPSSGRAPTSWTTRSAAPTAWVHAADLFGTANLARDLAGVIGLLGLGPVDLYGDSYGSWFSQVFIRGTRRCCAR